ncbi:MAG: amidohydrolase family protein [Bacteroidota bacterium]
MRQHQLLFFLLILFLSACRSPKEVDTNIAYTAFIGATIIDGRGNPPLEDYVILVQEKEIVRVAPRQGFDYPLLTQKIDCRGQYIIPGLIDMHAHITVLPLTENGTLSRTYNLGASLTSLRQLLEYGITTVRNPAAPTRDGVYLRGLSEEDSSYIGPRIVTAGAALNRGNSPGPFVRATTPRSIRYEIQQQAEAGVDIIKVYGALSPKLTKVAIEAAHNEGLEVLGHLGATSWTEAIKMDIDAITHAAPWHRDYLSPADRKGYNATLKERIYWLEKVDYDGPAIQEMLTLLVDSQVVVDPTLIAMKTKFWADDSTLTQGPDTALVDTNILKVWRNASFVGDWTEEDFEKAKSLWPKLIELTRLMYEKGVHLTAGSDFPNPWVWPGRSLHRELLIMQEAGIPNLDIIKIATYNGARALHLERKIGAIADGLEADFLILEKNPLEDISHTTSIFGVVQRGNLVLEESVWAKN